MTMLRRVLLLLSVAVLLREGSSNSPLGFLRDLKNRIFAPSNATDPTEEPPLQCSGLDQDGVCALPKTAVNGSLDESNNLSSTDTLDNPELSNGTQSSDPADMLANDQLRGNETIDEESYNTNNTLYYDEQEWNSTGTNNTDSYRNNFEYPENEQNETDFNSEAPAANGEAMSDQTGNARSKRQIDTVEISIKLKTPGATSTPLTLSTTVLTGKSENSTNSSGINESNNATGGKEDILNASKSNTFSVQNESIIADVYAKVENETVVMNEMAGNETRENIIGDGQKTSESINTTLDCSKDLVVLRSNDTISDFSKGQNTTEENINDETNLINCTDCVAEEESKALQNISLNLDKYPNGTESTDFEQGKTNENSTQESNSFINGLPNITKLKDILENSTRIIKKIVQNIIPAIYEEGNETNANGINDTKLENNGLLNTEVTNSLGAVKSNNTEIDGGDEIDNEKLKSTTIQTDKSTDSLNKTTDTSQVNNTNIIESYPLELNLNDSKAFERNIAGNVGIKRDRRSINFTILSDDDDEGSDLSISTFPDASESPNAEQPSSRITNPTESSSWNGTQEIEVVGPVCIKQYEQCTNSTDCCEDYECIRTDENNSTSYCDLRPVNLTLSTSLPITEDNTE